MNIEERVIHMNDFTYRGVKTKSISFPLGGIGTGCIGLAGNGRLIDWELLNRPNKRGQNVYSHFAIKAEANGAVVDARVLQGDLQSNYLGEPVRGGVLHSGFGFGPDASTLAGMPHFKDTVFKGKFPMAEVQYLDDTFPGEVTLTAFNPFIPSNEDDSSLPAAFFMFEIANTTDSGMDFTISLSAANLLKTSPSLHRYDQQSGVHRINMRSETLMAGNPNYGDLTIATDSADANYQTYWYRGGWCDALEMYWRDFTKPGQLVDRHYSPDSKYRESDMASLAGRVHIPPGEKRTLRFTISWSYPYMYNHWNPEPNGKRTVWKNHYATRFEDSGASAIYAFKNWERLLNETVMFRGALFASTLPSDVLDAISANLSVLKSPTCLRLEDGTFYGFEGCIENVGCCEGSCTHVWNYAYALPFLFPRLERSMRDLDFKHNRREDGRMSFRLMLPLGRERADFRACVDGQFGGIMKLYRDWKISGDRAWLEQHWPAVKTMISYAWAESNDDLWDPNQGGVLFGRQHHTLDMELYGPNAWLTGFYLGALKAGAEMADYAGDSETAELYRELFNKGKAYADHELFNGEYYQQKVDLSNDGLLRQLDSGTSLFGESAVDAYWNKETEEIKYQIGEGCSIDQVVAQWHANLSGLGEIFEPGQTKQALKAIYQYNFKPAMRKEANAWRIFSLNEEAGLVICAWPEGKYRPAVPLTYASETMTGFEYQAAAHMIQEGLLDEGISVVRAIRDRYDGEKRNPWNEIECGSNYARSMASYSLLLAYSGFQYDRGIGRLGFLPKKTDNLDYFQAFWSLEDVWGTFRIETNQVEIRVLYGEFVLSQLTLDAGSLSRIQFARLDNEDVKISVGQENIYFIKGVKLLAGKTLIVSLK
jgi:non-lysosomal glucosylceramidase